MAEKSNHKIRDFFKPRRREVVTVQLDSDDESGKPKIDSQRRSQDSKNASNHEKSNRPGTSPRNETPRSKLQERRLSLEKMRLEVLEQKERERKSRLSLSNFDHSESESDNESKPKAPVKDIRHYFRPDSQRHRNKDKSSTSDKQAKPPTSDKKKKTETVEIESDSSSSTETSDNQANPQDTEAQKEISRSKIQERKLLLEKMRQKVLEQKEWERKSRLPIVDVPEPEEPEESSSEESEPTSTQSNSSGSSKPNESSSSAQIVVQDVLHKKREHNRRDHHKSTSSKKSRVEEPVPSTSSSAHDVRTALRSQNRGRLSPPPNKPVEITFESDTDDEDEDARSDKSHTSEEEQLTRFRSDEVCVVCQSLKTTHKIIRQPWHYDVAWCKCQNCVPKKYMPNYHRICCREISFVVDKLKDELDIDNKKHPCVTSHPEFDRQVLQMEALKKIGGVDRYRKPGGPKRSEAYIASLSYVQWTMGSVILGMLIPTCVRKKIMDHFQGQKLPVAYAVSKICSEGIHCKFSMAESFPASTL